MKLQSCAILLSSTLVGLNTFGADSYVKTPPLTPPASATSEVSGLPSAATPAPAPVVVTAPAPAKTASDVVKMFNAGVKEDAILAYVATAPKMAVNADDIIFLHDHGVSTTVITAMIQHHPETAATPVPVTPPLQPQQPADTYYQAAGTQPTYVEAGYPDYYNNYYSYPYGYSYPYSYSYGYPYWYPSFWLGGSFVFGNGGHHHNDFHGNFHNGAHSGLHTVPTTTFHGGGLHTVGGVHTTVAPASGFHGSVHTAATAGGFHSAASGGFHGGTMSSGGFHGGSMSSGGSHGGGGGGGSHGGGGHH